MKHLQAIFNLAEICSKHGIENAVLSPGSRCAPITIAFARHPKINTKTVSDERSAAFIGMGMAQHSKKPTVLVCTSGSAAYNYAPAIAEAYYQQIPMVVITADRPPEWIDQYDGQTIRQDNIYGNHIKASYTLPVDVASKDAEWHFYRLVNEAINTSKQAPFGPVHINLPIREPFYPENGLNIEFDTEVHFFEEIQSKATIGSGEIEKLQAEWKQYKNKLVVLGQQDDVLELPLARLAKEHKIPVVGDVISNAHSIEKILRYPDLFLGNHNKDVLPSLHPDLLITVGKSVMSKNLKLFLRKYKPKAHWHIQPFGDVADTYQSLSKIIRMKPATFFEQVCSKADDEFEFQKQENFYNIWEIEDRKAARHIESFNTEELNELIAYKEVLNQLPDNVNLHIANSMAVRYVNFLGIPYSKFNIKVFANRGTSGIDGSNSTAVGSALQSDEQTLLLTGDMAFLYDRNAFWHNYNVPNLKIVVFNNHGGGIFNMIKGPSDQPEYKEYFETRQQLKAKSVADEFGFEYIHCDKIRKLKNAVKALFNSRETTILEIETESDFNKEVLLKFKVYS